MAIIRNERSTRQEPVQVQQDETEREEEEIDYRWHPTEDEFVSSLTSDQWAELLSDPSFADSDQGRAVRCLHEYGEPATFQQLSIRYRGTMGRYRRWLSEAAQIAGERFGVEAPQKNDYGMDEWWPLLYLMRAAGKPGAGVFEMQLRPEVAEAFKKIEEKERQIRRAESARNLQRIEQLERARKEERERKAALAAAAASASSANEAPDTTPENEGASTPLLTQAEQEETPLLASSTEAPVVADVPVLVPTPQPESVPSLPATREFLELMEGKGTPSASRFVPSTNKGKAGQLDIMTVAAPLDYALCYAERLRYVLALIRAGKPGANAAAMARAMGDESVEHLQNVLNGQAIPSFEYLNRLRDAFFINLDRLEVFEGEETNLPVFCTLQEALGSEDALASLASNPPRQITYVVDDSKDRRTAVVLRYADLSCTLLVREAVAAEGRKSSGSPLDVFVRMVGELDDLARAKGISRQSRQTTAELWDSVAKGQAWPGILLA